MKRRALLPLLLLGLASAFYYRLVMEPTGFIYRPNSAYSDLTITHWPNALFIRRSLATWGQVPLWRPLIFGGHPFAANPLSGLWYPPNLLLLILPLTPAFNLLFILHAAWGGWGGHRLARSTGASRAGALLAALTVMFAPKAVAHLAAGHVGLYYAFGWLPWVLWAVRRLARRGGAREAATAAACAALLILADVRLGFYGGVAAALYGLYHALVAGRRIWRPALWGAVAGVLALALTAVQLLPLALVRERLNRGGLSLAESAIASLSPRYLLGLFIADHGGFQEWMTYVGAVALLLSAWGLGRWRNKERWLWGGVGLVAALYALGTNTPLYRLAYRALPVLHWVRGPARAWFLVVVAVAVLGAQGLTALERRRGRRQRATVWAAGLLSAALAGLGGSLALGLPLNVAVAAALWPLLGALLVLRAGGRVRSRAFAAGSLGLALLDLWLVGLTLYRVRPAETVLSEGAAAARWLAQQPGHFRVYSPSYSIPHHTGALYGIESVDGVDPFQLAAYADFMAEATRIDLPGYSVTIPSFPEVGAGEEMLLAHRGTVPDLELLGRLNVRYVAAAYPLQDEALTPRGEHGGVYVYENERALPRAFVIPESGTGDEVDAAQVRAWSPNRIEVEAEGPGTLVLSAVYDPDWRVRVDGRPAEVRPARGLLRRTYLEAGTHKLSYIYHPAGLLGATIVTLLGCVCTILLWRIRLNPLHASNVPQPGSRIHESSEKML
jgi:hypothetical protein